MTRRRLRPMIAVVSAVIAFACIADVLGPAVAVSLTPRDTAVFVGATFSLRAVTIDARLDERANDPVSLTNLHSTVLDVSGDQITALTLGRGLIGVTANGLSGTLTDVAGVSVVPSGTIAGVTTSGASSVVVLNLDGSARKTLVLAGRDGGKVTWSPDGLTLAFEHAGATIQIVNLAGNARQLAVGRDPRFSRDGQWIYYDTLDQYGSGVIWRIHPDSSGGPEALAIRGLHPDPSPDGTILAFALDGSPTFNITIRVVAGGATQLVALNGIRPRWSPAGDWIGYIAPDGSGVWIVHPDGTGATRVSPSHRHYLTTGLDWSPDGAWLLARSDSALDLLRVASGETLPLFFGADLQGAAWKH